MFFFLDIYMFLFLIPSLISSFLRNYEIEKIQRWPFAYDLQKNRLCNFQKIHRKTHVLESLQASCNFLKKEALAQMFPSEFCKTSKSNLFTEHLWVTASQH